MLQRRWQTPGGIRPFHHRNRERARSYRVGNGAAGHHALHGAGDNCRLPLTSGKAPRQSERQVIEERADTRADQHNPK